MNLDHLHALQDRLHRTKHRLTNAKCVSEANLFSFYVSQIEREIDGERDFLGLDSAEIDDDALLFALLGDA